jgi:Kdo2-lipid IVA lauroyltransferase/acyltransferase
MDPMDKPRSRLLDFLIYVAVRVVVAVLQAVPYRTACAWAEGLAWLVYLVNKRHRQVALDNLRHAFPGRYTERQLDGMVRNVYRHFLTLLIDIVHTPRRLRLKNYKRSVGLDTPRWVDLLLCGRPLLLVTAHYGNWEIGGYVLGLLGFQTHAVARELDNPYLDDFLRAFRQRTGQGLIAKKGDYDRMQSILANNGIIATLGDQDAGQKGLFVDFFGRPASTHKAVAYLALEYRTPMVVLVVRKRDPQQFLYDIMIEDVILPEEYDDNPRAVTEMTQRFTSALERLIRAAPEQYFWLHRRWKHQPPVRKAKRAA